MMPGPSGARRYVIVGNSAAGLAALRAIRALDDAGQVTLVAAEARPAYSRVLLTPFIAGRLPEEALYLADAGEYRRLRAELLSGVAAAALDVSRREVMLDDGRVLPYDALLLATGACAAFPRGTPVGLTGIQGLRTLEDARAIREAVARRRRVAVIGAGPVGLKLTCALCEAGAPPDVVVASSHILSQVADGEAAAIVQAHLGRYGVRFHLDAAVQELVEGADGLEALGLTDGSGLPCGLAVYCKGAEPAVALAAGQVETGVGVRVDDAMRTSAEGVYTAGDVAEVWDVVACRRRVGAIWPHAVAQGRVAGTNMAGGDARFRGGLQRNAADVLGLPFVSMGHVRVRYGDGCDAVVERTGRRYRKLVLREGRLVGAVLVGDVSEAGRLQAAIRKDEARACEVQA